jgi:DNA-binding IclR family transcriptional regulator
MKEPASSANYQIRAVDRALDILEVFLRKEPELSLAAICEQTGLPKSTVFKILAVLEQREYVRKGQNESSYRIGLQAFRLGSRYLAGLSLVELARPSLERLTARFSGCLANLGILHESKVLYLDIVENSRPRLHHSHIGMQDPASCTALGKALLAGLPDAELLLLVQGMEMPRFTAHSLTDACTLGVHLAQVRRQGYALDDEESSLGALCIGAAICDHQGRAVAAISLSGVKAAIAQQVPEMAAELRQAAAEISRLLGYDGQVQRSEAALSLLEGGGVQQSV